MAVPGFLLSGWAPAQAVGRRTRIAIRDLTSGGDESLRLGVAFGMAEVAQTAHLTHLWVAFDRVDGPRVPTPGDVAIEVVASADDSLGAAAASCGVPRIHTCPLREWRPDAWSVASRRSDAADAAGCDWHPALTRSGAGQLNARFEQHAGRPMDQAAWRGWMAVKVAYEAAVRLQAGEDDLLALEFDGYKGVPLRFAEDGHLRQPTVRTGADARPIIVAPTQDADDTFHV